MRTVTRDPDWDRQARGIMQFIESTWRTIVSDRREREELTETVDRWKEEGKL